MAKFFASWFLWGLLCLASATTLAVPLVDVPLPQADPVELDPPNPLIAEARELLAKQQIKRTVERLVARKQLHPDHLPIPETVPSGSVRLEISDKQIPVADRLFTKATWSTSVPKDVDRQFIYHLQVAHLVGRQYQDGHRTWGVAMTKFNGNTYGTVVSSAAESVGDHRVLGILCAWSIRTEETHVLDVQEQTYSVVER